MALVSGLAVTRATNIILQTEARQQAQINVTTVCVGSASMANATGLLAKEGYERN